MAITVFIRYRLEPHKRDAFETYARRWLTIIPKCGGDLIGYWMPHEGTNDVAYGLISFQSLAAYEAYRGRLRTNPEAAANIQFAEEQRFIVAERRTFLRPVSCSGTAAAGPRARAIPPADPSSSRSRFESPPAASHGARGGSSRRT